jgi:hypothetical protein
VTTDTEKIRPINNTRNIRLGAWSSQKIPQRSKASKPETKKNP